MPAKTRAYKKMLEKVKDLIYYISILEGRAIMLDKILKKVKKPTRYTGGEFGSIVKDGSQFVRIAFCFPDVYDVGMSNLGMSILSGTLNEREDTYCERVFAPWEDMERELRENDLALFGLESQEAITNHDMIMFTLQYEMSYTNILNMLELAKIPLLASERENFVIAGGPCAYNPEPLADFIDFFVLGEGEEVVHEIVDAYVAWKKSGAAREEYLRAVAEIDGVYVPSFYNIEYNADNTIKSIEGKIVTKRIVTDFDNTYAVTRPIVPFGEIVHDRIVLEVFRGCDRGCRFCQAGMVYRPIRERSASTLINQAKELIANTGYEEISLASLSTSDYTQFEELCNGLLELSEGNNINISLPSLRVDNFSLDIMQKVQSVRKSGITFAPEAGSQRLRDVINKNVTEEDLKKSTSLIFNGGWSNVKLYFMIGLPTETDGDVAGIAHLAEVVAGEFFAMPKERRRKGLSVTVSTSTFIPKPHTPFQWDVQISRDETQRRQGILKSALKHKWSRYNWHDAETSLLEGVFARGDRRLGEVLLAAHKLGCKFDGWSEFFDFPKWMQAFEECGIDPYFYIARERSFEEVLPWDHIDCGVRKEFLVREREKAENGQTTKQCRHQCSACGHEGGDVCGR